MKTQKLNRRSAMKAGIASVVLAASVFTAPTVVAQSYPSQPITVVVPFATGGYNDRLARAFAPYLQEELGQPIEILNRGGAGTLLGNMLFMTRPADGYTIMMNSVTPYIPLTMMLQDPSYTLEDFHMINLPSRDATLAATSAGSDLDSWSEVIERLKADPRSLSIGIQPGSADYLNMVLAFEAEGIETDNMRIVTYDGGGPARAAAAGGQVDISLVGGEGFLPLLSEIKPLVVFNDSPFAGFEDTQLITEYADENGLEIEFVGGSMRGWVVHSEFVENHPDRYETLLAAFERATKREDVIQSLQNQSLATDWYGPEVSNRSYLSTSQLMQRFSDLLAE
ncbi:MAG: tripartite tricarboxylate transporter substrate-binding protein [Natronospirillum sp.]